MARTWAVCCAASDAWTRRASPGIGAIQFDTDFHRGSLA
jgi:hypothetical protein